MRGSRRKKQGIAADTPRSKFARAGEKARPQEVSKGGGEEKALERQIEEKRSALRASITAFVTPSEQASEDVFMDGLLGQVDAFRQALEGAPPHREALFPKSRRAKQCCNELRLRD